MSRYIQNNSSTWRSWFTAAKRPEVDSALREIYAQVAQSINEHRPICKMSGRCCDFDHFEDGHRLYVTGLEIAWAIQQIDKQNLPRSSQINLNEACIFQVDKQCSIHEIRPLGCRVFFCQAGTSEWQSDIYERFQNQLQTIHNRLGLDYQYMEWRAGLIAGLQNIH